MKTADAPDPAGGGERPIPLTLLRQKPPDAYRLGKRGRLRTDLGGMYFNAIFALIVGAVYAATSFE